MTGDDGSSRAAPAGARDEEVPVPPHRTAVPWQRSGPAAGPGAPAGARHGGAPDPLSPRHPGPAALARLARTRSGPGDLRLLLDGAHSRRLVLLKSLLTRLERRPGAVPGAVLERFEAHWRLLERAEARDPRAVRDTLGYPSVGTWLTRTLTAPDGDSLAHCLAYFGSVAAAAALQAGERFTLDLPAPGGRLALPGTGLVESGAPTLRLTAHGRTAHLTAGGRAGPVLLRLPGRTSGAGTGWRGLARLPGSGAFLDDLDPYRAPAEGVGSAALLAAGPDRTAGEPWTRRWRVALALLRATDRARAAEVTGLLRCVVPLARPAPHGRGGPKVSATFRAAPGAVFATLPDSAADLAEVLVHETQHSKLSVLHDLLPLHEAGPREVYRVAWRPDPRPFAGVLQGTYAHLALADFWTRAALRAPLAPGARRGARTRRDSYLRQVAEALPLLLESAELTEAGRQFATGMDRHLAALTRAAGERATAFGAMSPFGDVR
ncbi:HEXXH motif-containing putative peptide modification protein [Streptomyces sp. NPDC021096]|uniref:aKG-HExxH-type peptide beta-hydroxylase n=1 Tax=Streptomyces sp. NPDC021096 TaxID=3154792 RepID=UPI0033FB37F3